MPKLDEPTRDGETEIVLITNLPAGVTAAACCAADVCAKSSVEPLPGLGSGLLVDALSDGLAHRLDCDGR